MTKKQSQHLRDCHVAMECAVATLREAAKCFRLNNPNAYSPCLYDLNADYIESILNPSN